MVELVPGVEHTVNAIYGALEAKQSKWDGYGMGMGALGDKCDRAIWYEFRWATVKKLFEGRMLRLFGVGHREEDAMIADLRAIPGLTVTDRDPETSKQWSVTNVGGHLRGKLDGKVIGLPEAPETEHVLEIKTHSEKSFKKLLKEGVAKSKPAHYDQMQMYMHHTGLTRAFYFAACKNDSALYGERVEYDQAHCLRLIARVENIVHADRPPAKLHENPASKMAFACRYCDNIAQCHEGEFARVNCRTCLHSTPVEGGWSCERFGNLLSYDDQKQGCGSHLYIPELVPGKQVDCDPEAETVTYVLIDGSKYVDGLSAIDAVSQAADLPAEEVVA